MARDWHPSVGIDRAAGLAWAGGYVGDGVTAANVAGRTLADLILGRDSELTRLPWVQHRSRRWEPEPLRWLGVNLAVRAMRGADEVERRTGRPSWRARAVDAPAGSLSAAAARSAALVYAGRMVNGVEVLRYTAFSDDPARRQPGRHRARRQRPRRRRHARDRRTRSATARPRSSGRRPSAGDYRLRYFSPVAEVPFCGHATIASAVALADHGAGGELRFQTPAGEVAVQVRVATGRPHPWPR